MKNQALATMAPIVIALLFSLSGSTVSHARNQPGCENFWEKTGNPVVHWNEEVDCVIWNSGVLGTDQNCPGAECGGCVYSGNVDYYVAPTANSTRTLTWCNEVIERAAHGSPTLWIHVVHVYQTQALIDCPCQLELRVTGQNLPATPPCDIVFFKQTHFCDCCSN